MSTENTLQEHIELLNKDKVRLERLIVAYQKHVVDVNAELNAVTQKVAELVTTKADVIAKV